MNPHHIGQDPSCSWMLHRLSLVMGKGRSLRLQRLTDAVLSGRIDESAARHHQQEGHEALGLVQIERGGSTLWLFQQAAPPRRVHLACIAFHKLLGGRWVSSRA
jgi:hypothetical protein